jgi:hypothetical protein
VTPIDAALLFVVAIVALWAWLIRRSTWMTAVLAVLPALVVVEVAVPDERLRLLLIGVMTVMAFGVVVFVSERASGERRAASGDERSAIRDQQSANSDPRPAISDQRSAISDQRPAISDQRTYVALGLSATFLLRWLPLATVEWKKELVVLAGVALLLALTKERTPLSLGVALAVALVTPLHPGRMVVYPALVAVAQWLIPWPVAGAVVMLAAVVFARYSLAALYVLAAAALLAPLAFRWSPRATRVVLVFAALLVALWPWSAAVARLLPLPIAGVAIAVVAVFAASGRFATIAGPLLLLVMPYAAFPDQQPEVLGAALESSQSVDVDVAPDVREVVLRISGANMPRMRPGRVVGEIDAVDRAGHRTTRVLRIGDVADWGFMRREQFFFSNNVPPRNASGDLRGYGNDSYLWGAGRIPIRFAAPPASLRVVAANDLPGGAKLQVETVEYRRGAGGGVTGAGSQVPGADSVPPVRSLDPAVTSSRTAFP